MRNDLGLNPSNLTVAIRSDGRDFHDFSLATDRTPPPQGQRVNRRNAVATCSGMFHWQRPPCGAWVRTYPALLIVLKQQSRRRCTQPGGFAFVPIGAEWAHGIRGCRTVV